MFTKLMSRFKPEKRECKICNKEFQTEKDQEDHNETIEHKENMEIEEMVWKALNEKGKKK